MALIISQMMSEIEVLQTNVGSEGFSHPSKVRTINIKEQDPRFTPFQKVSPDGQETWFSHKLADALSSRSIKDGQKLLDYVTLSEKARPNHVEFVENDQGKVIYASATRIEDDGPERIAYSSSTVPPNRINLSLVVLFAADSARILNIVHHDARVNNA